MSEGGTLRFIHQDHLGSSSYSTDDSGGGLGGVTYLPFGGVRTNGGEFGTDRKFTGQRADATGLYFYNTRYYDSELGRFVSPDTVIPDASNPQAWNKYTYVLNDPLKYTDPTVHFWDWAFDVVTVAYDVFVLVQDPTWESAAYLGADVVLGIVPFVPAGVGPLARVGKWTGEAKNLIITASRYTGKHFQDLVGLPPEN